MSTWKAAAYRPGTVTAWADDIADRSREILAVSPLQEITSQAQPFLTEIEGYIDSLFGDGDELIKTRAITDQGETPLGADLERAVSDLGAEVAITPQERSRARRKVFDREVPRPPEASKLNKPIFLYS